MKYFAVFILAIACVIVFSFFTANNTEDPNKLKIKAFVFDESIDNPNDWDGSAVFDFEELELGVPRNTISLWTTGLYNINVYFEYEGGVVQVTSEDVQLSIGEGARPFYFNGGYKEESNRDFGYQFHVNESGYMTLRPVVGGTGFHELDDKHLDPAKPDGYPGYETYVYVDAFKTSIDELPVASATLKLTQLYDDIYPDGKHSSFFQIELISYE